MRDPNRIEPMLEVLRQAWMKYPDLRLGQLLVNAARPAAATTFYVEDNVMLKGLEALRDA